MSQFTVAVSTFRVPKALGISDAQVGAGKKLILSSSSWGLAPLHLLSPLLFCLHANLELLDFMFVRPWGT